MKIYTLHKKQKLPITVEQAWTFLCNPANLEKLTPSEMNMKIISGADKPMYAGQVLQYSVTPLAGLKTKWISEITQYKHQNPVIVKPKLESIFNYRKEQMEKLFGKL